MALLRILSVGLVLAIAILGASAQDRYPSRAIKIVVPNPPGGVTDLLARIVAQGLSQAWSQPVVVDNRPGGDEMIGADAVAKAPADGYTLLVSSNAPLTAAPHLHRHIRYDPQKDFTPILMLGQITPVLSVSAALPVQSVAELIAAAKAKPGVLNYGSFGNGTYAHLSMEDFKRRTGTDLMHIPYKGSAPAITALIRNDISVLVVNKSTIDAHVSAGTVRILAAAGAKRAAALPNLATVAESGVPGFVTGAWWGLLGPANLPRATTDKIRSDVIRVLGTPEARKLFETNTLEFTDLTPEQLAQFLRNDIAHQGALIKQAGLTPE
jgi:tripartite-type tricarboxylate transporter receptor subunit TctC